MGRRAGVKVELAPSSAQASRLASFAGTSRFVWNWGLGEKQRHYREVILPARERIEAGSSEDPVKSLTAIDLTARATGSA